MKHLIILISSLLITNTAFAWGFRAHQVINEMAVYTLPPEMIVFYKHHLNYIIENAVNPDKRRYAVEGEAQKHFIDIDIYGDSAVFKMPRYWNTAVEKHSEDTLQAYGIVPWHVYRVKYQLTDAFARKDIKAILRLSADLGHYIADANVPLHTTHNYNGQLTGQRGIHGFWEGRLPEVYAMNYDFFSGKATYLFSPQLDVWNAVVNAHMALDSVLVFEKKLSERFPEDKKYSFEQRGAVTVKVYSRKYTEEYHDLLKGQVERQMRSAIKMIGDFWFTCWVDAGQPDLKLLTDGFKPEDAEELEAEKRLWEKATPNQEKEICH